MEYPWAGAAVKRAVRGSPGDGGVAHSLSIDSIRSRRLASTVHIDHPGPLMQDQLGCHRPRFAVERRDQSKGQNEPAPLPRSSHLIGDLAPTGGAPIAPPECDKAIKIGIRIQRQEAAPREAEKPGNERGPSVPLRREIE